MVKKVTTVTNNYESTRLDSDETEMFFEIDRIRAEVNKEFEDDKFFGMLFDSFIKGYFISLFNSNATEMNNVINKLIGETLPIGEEIVSQHYTAFKNEIMGKVKFWIDSYFTRLKNLSSKYNSGKITIGKLLKSIAVLGQTIAKNTPAGIARDTIGKFNSKIQGTLFTALGFSYYTWQTAGDERVRGNPEGLYPKANPSHYDMQGILCRWDNAMVYSTDGGKTWQSRVGKMEKLHPGEANNCRCTALVFIKQILDNINRS